MRKTLLLIYMVMSILSVKAEDGHLLWLRMSENNRAATIVDDSKKQIKAKLSHDETETFNIAITELGKYIKTDVTVHVAIEPSAPQHDGFTISRTGNKLHIKSSTAQGVLYGAYHLIRLQETDHMPKDKELITEIPSSRLRLLNHWDNLNGTIERGYAGHSIFWDAKDDLISKNTDEIIQYARANASIGINGTVLNNVNASPKILTTEYVGRVERIARILRPYGLRVYLSVNFASPKSLGDLDTADPLDARVQQWWKEKAKEIYTLIPDFGGFLVKANSEGEPGPGDYNRTHVEGANMLAEALKSFGGIVMWRAFVYAADSPDRAMQAYDEFMPYDGKFADNVILQVKNGPIDFQPREPIHPLFFSMKNTPVMPELQITQEYLGHSIHNVFLAPMWHELLDHVSASTGVAGVANIGNSVNWCGSDMAQANWYAFGRLSWNPTISSQQIADEFVRQTFTKTPEAVEVITDIMLRSHEACVSYMMPLGLHHIFAGGHHYGPEPWCYRPGWREDWLPRYYHRADSAGIGFDRTTRGSRAVTQYPDEIKDLYDDMLTCPEQYLLWFHHVGWGQTLPCGETMWERLCHKYDEGVRNAEDFVSQWNKVKPYIDTDRFNAIRIRYERQAKDAWWWRDACLLYFAQFSEMELPAGCPEPRHNLEQLMKFNLPIDNYTAPDIDMLDPV